MKTIDFETGAITESNQNTTQVNEFLMTALVVGVFSYMALHAALDGYTKIRTQLRELQKLREERKVERQKRRAERKAQNREDEEAEVLHKQKMQKLKAGIQSEQVNSQKYAMAANGAHTQLKDDKENKTLRDRLNLIGKINAGKATPEEIQAGQKEVNNWAPTPEEKKIQKQVQTKVTTEITDEEAKTSLKKAGITPESVETNIKKNNPITPQSQGSKEEIKDMEVEDPETGKKVVRKVHIGPHGGKYYWPDGSPHDAEHKVYVD